MLPTARSILHYPTTPSFRADTQAWLDVATGNYSTAERQALDALLGGLDADGILLLDRLFLLHFGDNAADSLRCVVSRQSATSTGGTPATFTRRQGWRGNTSTTGFLDTNWAPSTGVNLSVNNAAIGCYLRENAANLNSFRVLMGCVQGSAVNNCTLGVQSGNTETSLRLNVTGSPNQPASTVVPTPGSYSSVSRASISEMIGRRDSTELAIAVASSGLCSASMYLLARNNNGVRDGAGTHQIAMAHAGGAQTTAQNASFRSRMNTFHTAIGFS